MHGQKYGMELYMGGQQQFASHTRPETQPVQRQKGNLDCWDVLKHRQEGKCRSHKLQKMGVASVFCHCGRLGHFMKHCLVRWTVTLLSAYASAFLMTDKHERFVEVASMGQCFASLGFQAGYNIVNRWHQSTSLRAPNQPAFLTLSSTSHMTCV